MHYLFMSDGAALIGLFIYAGIAAFSILAGIIMFFRKKLQRTSENKPRE